MAKPFKLLGEHHSACLADTYQDEDDGGYERKRTLSEPPQGDDDYIEILEQEMSGEKGEKIKLKRNFNDFKIAYTDKYEVGGGCYKPNTVVIEDSDDDSNKRSKKKPTRIAIQKRDKEEGNSSSDSKGVIRIEEVDSSNSVL